MQIIKTDEQNLIINSVSKFLAIKAFAGSGKTTTLKEFAYFHKNKKILYIAYNKETARQARLTFPSNVTSKTAHSIAYGKFGKELEHKLDRKKTLPFKPETIRKFFGFKRTDMQICKDLFDIINNYCFSVSRNLNDSIPFKNYSESRETILLYLNILWNAMIDPKSNFPTTADIYLKQYQLSNPKLDYDFILFDEAQDANPLILDIILSQKSHSNLVFVGDEHQSIYLFRGAKNSLNIIRPDDVLYLTTSFRFGERIAYAANAILKTLKNEIMTIKGSYLINDSLGEIDKNKQFALITRTNSNLFLSAINAYEKNMKMFFVGGFNNYNFEKFLDIENLYLGNINKIKDNYIKTFKTFDDYKITANYTNDNEMKYHIKVVEKYAGNLNIIINGIKNNLSKNKNEADIILSTVHKSKGLEFEQVLLSNDFPILINSDGEFNYKLLKEEEINILYVAATRAINKLQINRTLYNIINYYEKNKNDIEEYNKKAKVKDDNENSKFSNIINKIENKF